VLLLLRVVLDVFPLVTLPLLPVLPLEEAFVTIEVLLALLLRLLALLVNAVEFALLLLLLLRASPGAVSLDCWEDTDGARAGSLPRKVSVEPRGRGVANSPCFVCGRERRGDAGRGVRDIVVGIVVGVIVGVGAVVGVVCSQCIHTRYIKELLRGTWYKVSGVLQ
jgi:hypothetical protein